MAKTYRARLKRFCIRCGKETVVSSKKSIYVKGGQLAFTVCLECGDPHGYKSFNDMLTVFHQSKKRQRVVKPKVSKPFSKVNRSGKAGLLSKTYRLYLQTDHWKELRKRKLKQHPICELCKKEKATEVHHLTYVDGNKESILYGEELWQLASACRECHRKQHHIK